MLRRGAVLLAAVAMVMMFTAASASAASPHFKHGGQPTCTITSSGSNSATVVCTGTLAGLGNADLVITTSVNGTAVYQCQNAGGNIAPGQNKVLVGPATSTTSIPAGQIKNGNLRFTTNPATLSAPATVSGAVAGCPNNNWTGVNPVVTVTNISLVIEQPPGTQIFSCSASDPSGLSGTVTLSC